MLDSPALRSELLIFCDVTLDLLMQVPAPERLEAPKEAYSEIPKKFTSVEEWPPRSNLRCWNCSMKFDTYAKFVPTNPAMCDGKDVCVPLGNFCEWNCVVSYVRAHYADDVAGDIIYLICLFESKWTHRRRTVIIQSPEISKMRAYCGSNGLTEAEWRQELEMLNQSTSG